jgi:hypothetical protein
MSERRYLLEQVDDAAGELGFSEVSYPRDLAVQMLEYSALTAAASAAYGLL